MIFFWATWIQWHLENECLINCFLVILKYIDDWIVTFFIYNCLFEVWLRLYFWLTLSSLCKNIAVLQLSWTRGWGEESHCVVLRCYPQLKVGNKKHYEFGNCIFALVKGHFYNRARLERIHTLFSFCKQVIRYCCLAYYLFARFLSGIFLSWFSTPPPFNMHAEWYTS